MSQHEVTYQQIFEQSGLFPDQIGPSDVFYETVTVSDYDAHNNVIPDTEREQTYAILTTIAAPNEPFTGDPTTDAQIEYSACSLLPNGSIVSEHADIEDTENVDLGKRAIIRPLATVIGLLVLGDDSELGPRSRIGNSVIGDNTSIGYDNYIMHSILQGNVRTGNKVRLLSCSIYSGGVLGDNVSVRHGSVLGVGAKLGDEVKVEPKAIIGRNFEAGEGVTVGNGARVGDDVTADPGITIPRKKKVRSDQHLEAVSTFRAVKKTRTERKSQAA